MNLLSDGIDAARRSLELCEVFIQAGEPSGGSAVEEIEAWDTRGGRQRLDKLCERPTIELSSAGTWPA